MVCRDHIPQGSESTAKPPRIYWRDRLEPPGRHERHHCVSAAIHNRLYTITLTSALASLLQDNNDKNNRKFDKIDIIRYNRSVLGQDDRVLSDSFRGATVWKNILMTDRSIGARFCWTLQLPIRADFPPSRCIPLLSVTPIVCLSSHIRTHLVHQGVVAPLSRQAFQHIVESYAVLQCHRLPESDGCIYEPSNDKVVTRKTEPSQLRMVKPHMSSTPKGVITWKASEQWR